VIRSVSFLPFVYVRLGQFILYWFTSGSVRLDRSDVARLVSVVEVTLS
jgi:hypothetical protein